MVITTMIIFDITVDIVTISKPKITKKCSLWTALTLKLYHVWCWHFRCINVLVGPMLALNFIQICDNHYFSNMEMWSKYNFFYIDCNPKYIIFLHKITTKTKLCTYVQTLLGTSNLKVCSGIFVRYVTCLCGFPKNQGIWIVRMWVLLLMIPRSVMWCTYYEQLWRFMLLTHMHLSKIGQKSQACQL